MRFLALFVTLALAVPSPAYSLRPAETTQSGIEAELTDALVADSDLIELPLDSRFEKAVGAQLEKALAAGVAVEKRVAKDDPKAPSLAVRQRDETVAEIEAALKTVGELMARVSKDVQRNVFLKRRLEQSSIRLKASLANLDKAFPSANADQNDWMLISARKNVMDAWVSVSAVLYAVRGKDEELFESLRGSVTGAAEKRMLIFTGMRNLRNDPWKMALLALNEPASSRAASGIAAGGLEAVAISQDSREFKLLLATLYLKRGERARAENLLRSSGPITSPLNTGFREGALRFFKAGSLPNLARIALEEFIQVSDADVARAIAIASELGKEAEYVEASGILQKFMIMVQNADILTSPDFLRSMDPIYPEQRGGESPQGPTGWQIIAAVNQDGKITDYGGRVYDKPADRFSAYVVLTRGVSDPRLAVTRNLTGAVIPRLFLESIRLYNEAAPRAGAAPTAAGVEGIDGLPVHILNDDASLVGTALTLLNNSKIENTVPGVGPAGPFRYELHPQKELYETFLIFLSDMVGNTLTRYPADDPAWWGGNNRQKAISLREELREAVGASQRNPGRTRFARRNVPRFAKLFSTTVDLMGAIGSTPLMDGRMAVESAILKGGGRIAYELRMGGESIDVSRYYVPEGAKDVEEARDAGHLTLRSDDVLIFNLGLIRSGVEAKQVEERLMPGEERPAHDDPAVLEEVVRQFSEELTDDDFSLAAVGLEEATSAGALVVRRGITSDAEISNAIDRARDFGPVLVRYQLSSVSIGDHPLYFVDSVDERGITVVTPGRRYPLLNPILPSYITDVIPVGEYQSLIRTAMQRAQPESLQVQFRVPGKGRGRPAAGDLQTGSFMKMAEADRGMPRIVLSPAHPTGEPVEVPLSDVVKLDLPGIGVVWGRNSRPMTSPAADVEVADQFEFFHGGLEAVDAQVSRLLVRVAGEQELHAMLQRLQEGFSNLTLPQRQQFLRFFFALRNHPPARVADLLYEALTLPIFRQTAEGIVETTLLSGDEINSEYSDLPVGLVSALASMGNAEKTFRAAEEIAELGRKLARAKNGQVQMGWAVLRTHLDMLIRFEMPLRRWYLPQIKADSRNRVLRRQFAEFLKGWLRIYEELVSYSGAAAEIEVAYYSFWVSSELEKGELLHETQAPSDASTTMGRLRTLHTVGRAYAAIKEHFIGRARGAPRASVAAQLQRQSRLEVFIRLAESYAELMAMSQNTRQLTEVQKDLSDARAELTRIEQALLRAAGLAGGLEAVDWAAGTSLLQFGIFLNVLTQEGGVINVDTPEQFTLERIRQIGRRIRDQDVASEILGYLPPRETREQILERLPQVLYADAPGLQGNPPAGTNLLGRLMFLSGAAFQLADMVHERRIHSRMSEGDALTRLLIEMGTKMEPTITDAAQRDGTLSGAIDPGAIEREGLYSTVYSLSDEAQRAIAAALIQRFVTGPLAGVEAEETVPAVGAREQVRVPVVPSAVKAGKFLVLAGEGLHLLGVLGKVKTEDGQAIPIVALAADADQKRALEAWARDLWMEVSVVDLSQAPYFGDTDKAVRMIQRYYAGEKGLSRPLVIRRTDQLLEVAQFLEVLEQDRPRFVEQMQEVLQGGDLEQYV